LKKTVKIAVFSFLFALSSYSQSDYGNTYALIIGVSEYQDESLNLDYAEKDANFFKDFLLSQTGGSVPDSNIIEIYNADATFAQIHEKLNTLNTMVTNDRNRSRVFLFFSGHGEEFINKEGALVCSDFIRGGGTIQGKYPYDLLAYYLDDMLQRAEVFVFIDACYSGYLMKSDKIADIDKKHYGVNLFRFASSGSKFKSKEDPKDLKHGVFSYYLVKGLFGEADTEDGKVSFPELVAYVKKEVKDHTNEAQKPKSSYDEDRHETTTISTIDKKIAKSELTDIAANLSLLFDKGENGDLAFKSIEDNSHIGLLRDSFELYLDSGLLVTKNQRNAWGYYEKLKKANAPQRMINNAESELRVGLLNNVQLLLNEHIQNINHQPSVDDLQIGAYELEMVMKIIDKRDPFFKISEVRKLFLDAYSIIREKNKEKYKDAEYLLARIFMEYEDSAAYALNAMGMLYDSQGEFDLAVAYYNYAIDKSPRWVLPYSNLGNIYKRQANYSKALSLFNKALAIDSNAALLYNNLGNVYLAQGRVVTAEMTYRYALTIDSESKYLWHYNLGVVSELKGDLASALKHYQRSMELNAGYYHTYIRLGDYYSEHEGIQNFDRARKYYQDAITNDKYAVEPLVALADFYRKYEMDPEIHWTIEMLYKTAIRLEPNVEWPYFGLGYLYRDRWLSKADSTEYYMRLGFEQVGNSNAARYLARYYKQVGEYDSAVVYYVKALKLNSLNWDARRGLAKLYEKRQDFLDAEKVFLVGLELFPETPKVLYDIGCFYYRMRNFDNINGGVNMSTVMLLDAFFLIRDDEDYSALWFRKALSIDSNYVPAHIALASVYASYWQRDEQDSLATMEASFNHWKKTEQLNPNYCSKEDIINAHLLSAFIESSRSSEDGPISADQKLRDLAEYDADNFLIWYTRASLNYMNTTHPEQLNLGNAIVYIDSAINLANITQAEKLEALVLKGRILLSLKDYENALLIFNQVASIDSAKVLLDLSLVHSYLPPKTNKLKSICFFDEYQKNGNHISREVKYGGRISIMNITDTKNAENYYRKEQLNQIAMLRYNWWPLHAYGIGRYDIYQDLLPYNPGYESSELAFTQDSTNFIAGYAYTWLLLFDRDYENAHKVLDIVYDHHQDTIIVQKQGLHILRAEICFKNKEFERAIQEYEFLINEYDESNYHIKIAMIYYLMNDMDKSREYARYYIHREVDSNSPYCKISEFNKGAYRKLYDQNLKRLAKKLIKEAHE
jgi:tetratricopeptide (TPR) repeat protein